MSNTAETSAAGKEYRWHSDGTDGLRSYSYAASNPAWSYSTEPNKSNVIDNPGGDDDGAYRFSDSSTGQPFARRGNLYNWTAATLGSGLGLNTDKQQAPDSICPRGWQLPRIAVGNWGSMTADIITNKSFAKLLSTYSVGYRATGYNRLADWPLQYLPGGNYSLGYVTYRTTVGYWWSGIAGSDTNSYFLNPYPDEVNAQYDDGRSNGMALRCVVRTPGA